MTREEIESRINENIKYIATCETTIRELEDDNSELEQELKKLDVKVYEPMYLYPESYLKTDNSEKAKQHNAMEEYKHELSILNNGWFPDWKTPNCNSKGYLAKGILSPTIEYRNTIYIQELNDYEYFNPKIADQVIAELGELWKRGKDIK